MAVGIASESPVSLSQGRCRELLVGSDVAFDDRGIDVLKGVTGNWQTYGASTGLQDRSKSSEGILVSSGPTAEWPSGIQDARLLCKRICRRRAGNRTAREDTDQDEFEP